MVLPFLECHIVGVLQHVAFLDWLVSLNDLHISVLRISLWFDSSLFSVTSAYQTLTAATAAHPCLGAAWRQPWVLQGAGPVLGAGVAVDQPGHPSRPPLTQQRQ